MPLEKAEKSPFLSLRVARIVAIYFDKDAAELPSETNRQLDFTLGRAKVEWLDWGGQRDFVQLSFPTLSTSSVDRGRVIIPYGDLSMPSVDDVAVLGFRDPSNAIILGYLPANYRKLTDPNESVQGVMRRIRPGELTRKSRQQAEIYQDKAGATQIIVKAQPVSGSVLTDGSATAKVSDINQAAVPSEELVRVTVGESYTDDNFTAREMTADDKKVILRVKTATGTKINIDVAGNIEIVGAGTIKMTGTEVNFNAGEKGVARLDDEVKIDSDTDSTFISYLQAIADALITSGTGVLDGGAAYKTAIVAKLASIGVTSGSTAPNSATGKVTESSDTVKAGD